MTIKRRVLVDCRINNKSAELLSKMGCEIIRIPCDLRFDEPISAHPDIFITNLNNTWFIDREVNYLFTFLNNKIICDREGAAKDIIRYPDDCKFNCVNVGSKLICNKDITHKTVLDFAKNNNISIINVKQGYTKCSVCVVSNNAIITEDKSVSENAKIAGMDVLLIEKGHVRLSGYDYGFIGGCSGLLTENLLAFNGNIETHPNYRDIYDFCKKHNVEIMSLNEDDLYDVGSIIAI